MSGVPSEAEIQAQWRNSVAVLEGVRAYADGTLADSGGLFDVLVQSLEGEYTPASLANWAEAFRAGLSSLLDSGVARDALDPCLYEYAAHILTEGGGYESIEEIMRALYEHFHTNTLTVESRAIIYDNSATAGGSNVGNGEIKRLTTDENGYDMEACHVETKRFRCRADQNLGVQRHAERFEILGSAPSKDALLRSNFGSGEGARTTISSLHAGTGRGGSLLQNSSFSTFDATASPKFSSWTEAAVGGGIDQDATNYYRSHPGASEDGSLKMTGGGGTITLTQSLSQMRISKLDPSKPHFLRVMLNKTVGTALGGTVNLRLGSQTVSVTIAALGAGWQELLIPLDANCWVKNFDEDSFTVEIEWVTSTSGTLLVDDILFQEMDLIDGTYWVLIGGTTPWMMDDTLAFTDTGGAPATAKLQWWLFIAGLGYLPHTTGVPSFTEPA